MVMGGNDMPGRDPLSDQFALSRVVQEVEMLKERQVDLLLGQPEGSERLKADKCGVDIPAMEQRGPVDGHEIAVIDDFLPPRRRSAMGKLNGFDVDAPDVLDRGLVFSRLEEITRPGKPLTEAPAWGVEPKTAEGLAARKRRTKPDSK